MDAAANGQGIALAPRLLLDAEFEQGRLGELWRDARPGLGGHYLVCPEVPTSNPARDALIEWALAEVGGGVGESNSPR